MKLYIDENFNILDAVKLINVLIIKYRLRCTIMSERSLSGILYPLSPNLFVAPPQMRNKELNIRNKDKFVIYIYHSSLDDLENILTGKWRRYFHSCFI